MAAEKIRFNLGKLCLDFANTAQWHASENPHEKLRSYQDFVDWSRKEGLLSEADAQKLMEKAANDPIASANALKRAIELREAIYSILSSVAASKFPKKGDLEILNRNLAKTMAHSRIIPTQSGYICDINGNKEELDWMLKPIVRSTAELLTSNELDRVKVCADDRGCGWLFLDKSRNRSRRWCDMKDCGNRAKAKRFYQRRQKN